MDASFEKCACENYKGFLFAWMRSGLSNTFYDRANAVNMSLFSIPTRSISQ